MAQKMKKNKRLTLAIAAAIILASLTAYDYGYRRLKGEISAIREAQEIKERTLQKYITLISEKPALEKRIAALKEMRKTSELKMVEGKTIALATATLQNTVKGIITAAGGTISSERVGKTEETKMFKVINVSFDVVLPDPKALSDVLYAIETRTPYLNIKEVDSRLRNFREPRELVVKIDVTALYSGKI